MISAISRFKALQVSTRPPQQRVDSGRYSVFADGTPLVKTTGGQTVAIIASSSSVKKALAGLKPGDFITVRGQATEIVRTTVDAFHGPAISASRLIIQGPALPTFAGTIMHLGGQPGYPAGAFLRLDQPASFEGKSVDLVQLPGGYSVSIGARLSVQGELVAATSPNGTPFYRFNNFKEV